jgi:hypothetical protein
MMDTSWLAPIGKTAYLPLTIRSYAPVTPVFGVQMPRITRQAGLEQAVEAGVYWVRKSVLRWHEIQPQAGAPPDWSVVDEQSLINASENGIEVIAIVHFTPEWAQKVAGSYCGPIREDALDDFAQFLSQAVKRYSAPPYDIHYWELGNEPDIDPSLIGAESGFGCWGNKQDPYYGGSYYAQMLKRAYPAIKAADPKAQVLLGGLLLDCDAANPPPGKDCEPSKFLEGVLRGGGGPYFDIVSYHAYSNGGAWGAIENPSWSGAVTGIPEKTAFLRKVLKQYGFGGKALINSEAALRCPLGSDSCLETQTMYIPRAYAEALALDLEAQVYYAMINESWRYTGLIRPDLTPKPAYEAYKTAVSFLGSARYQSVIAGYPPKIEGYGFRQVDTGQRVDVIWSSDCTQRAVALPAGASAYNRYGSKVASSGQFNVDCGPVYIVKP